MLAILVKHLLSLGFCDPKPRTCFGPSSNKNAGEALECFWDHSHMKL